MTIAEIDAAADKLRGIEVIDVDTHVLEPVDLWTSRVSTAKWGDLVPHVEWDDKLGVEVWRSGDVTLSKVASPAAAGWSESPPKHPPRFSDVAPTIWDAPARLELMDEYGIHAQVLYPNVAGFGAGRFGNVDDRELRLALLQAYNDFLTDWSSEAPERLLPVMAVPFWDLDLVIAEMERCAGRNHRGVVMAQQPQVYGQPMLSDPHWNPMWAAAQEMSLPINFHIASGDLTNMQLLHESCGAAANYAAMPVTFFTGNCATVATLIGSGICHRYPDLKFVSVESGIGWIPFALDALDWMWGECGVTKEHPEYDLLPSEYFKRQIYACFWFEHGAMFDASLERLGPDNVLYETDFPHPTSMSPGPASNAVAPDRFIAERLGHLPEDTLRKILHDNAAKLYGVGRSPRC